MSESLQGVGRQAGQLSGALELSFPTQMGAHRFCEMSMEFISKLRDRPVLFAKT
jgi:hypothetical protein